MFITLQFPFIDLRHFLPDPPSRVPQRGPLPTPLHRRDLEDIVRQQEFIRYFGPYKLRGYIPKFHKETKSIDEVPDALLEDEEQWLNLKSLWKDEYIFASARRGLRLKGHEQTPLIENQVVLPRVKVRALRLSPFSATHQLWSPCIRIEIGVLYSVAQPITGDQLIRALNTFLSLQTFVPTYEKDGAGRTAIVSQAGKLKEKPLIDQKETLANLIVDATTSQSALKVHPDMVMAGEPLLTVHYTTEELTALPDTLLHIPRSSVQYINIGYLPLPQPRIGAWLFEMPHPYKQRKSAAKKRVIIRNYSVAVMRFWAELQSMLVLRKAIFAQHFAFDVRNNNLLQDYVNKGTNFLLAETKHGAQLNVIRNVIAAFRRADEEEYLETNHVFRAFRRQIANKLMAISKTEVGLFVSYSHKNAPYLKTIFEALIQLLSMKKIAYFDDTYIDAGREWEKMILNQIDKSSVFILLVSEHFISSEYINTVEIPRIVERYQRGKATIFPILVSGNIPDHGFLSSLQFLNPRHPLLEATEEELSSISSDLLQEIKNVFSRC
jgi:hypothetical protein